MNNETFKTIRHMNKIEGGVVEWSKEEILETVKSCILKCLKCPLTAVFCSPNELILKKKLNPSKWVVKGTYSAQNEYGALCSSNFVIIITIKDTRKGSMLNVYYRDVFLGKEHITSYGRPIDAYENRYAYRVIYAIALLITFLLIKYIIAECTSYSYYL